jgi:hypothetical protein
MSDDHKMELIPVQFQSPVYRMLFLLEEHYLYGDPPLGTISWADYDDLLYTIHPSTVLRGLTNHSLLNRYELHISIILFVKNMQDDRMYRVYNLIEGTPMPSVIHSIVFKYVE